MIQHYLKIAFRNLLKYKTHSLISAVCLSVGLVCFSLVNHIFDQMDADARKRSDFEQLVDFKLSNSNNQQTFNLLSTEAGILEERKEAGIEVLSYYSSPNHAEMLFIDSENQEHPFIVSCRRVNNGFFTMEQATLLYGNQLPQVADEVVISEKCASKVYGKQNPVGMFVTVAQVEEKQARKMFKIVNVVSEMGANRDADLFIPCKGDSTSYFNVQGILSENVDMKQLNRNLAQIKVSRESNVLHFAAIRVADQLDSFGRLVIMAFITFLSSLILLSGIINFLKFIIQMFYNRQRELVLRKCMGSQSKGLFLLLFAEVLWMFTIVFLLSLMLSEVIVPWLQSYLPQKLLLPISLPQLYIKQFQIFGILLLVCMLAILVPIYRLRQLSIIRFIRRRSSHWFRNLMMGLQLCICIFFLGVASGMVLYMHGSTRTIYIPLSDEESERIFRLDINSITMQKQSEMIMNDIQKIPAIEQIVPVRFNHHHPYGHDYTNYQTPDGHSIQLLVHSGSLDYFNLLGISLQNKQIETEDIVYISEAFAGILEQDSVRGIVKIGESTYRIGGIYKGLYQEDLASSYTQGSVFFPGKEANTYYLRVAKEKDMKEMYKQIESVCHRHIPESMPLSLHTLAEEKDMGTMSAGMTMGRDVAMILAGVSIMLVILSIYSSISMDTMARQKEVAIRKINGATPRVIAAIFGKTYFLLFVLAFAIAFPFTKIVFNQLIRGNTIANFNYWLWGSFLFIGVGVLILLTTGYKIYRIMHINPAEIIKNE